MFILTGIIGVFQLFEGPKSVGAVTIDGGFGNPSIGLPERSLQATALPSWQPSAEASSATSARTSSAVVNPAGTRNNGGSTPASPARATSKPASASTSKPTVVVSNLATAKPASTTTKPTAKATPPKPATTPPKATTSAPKPTQSVLKPTAPPVPSASPTCTRFLFFRICR